MNELQIMIATHRDAVKTNSEKRDFLRKEIERLQEEERQLKHIGHIHFVEKLAEWLVKDMSKRRVEILGPFGLCSEVSIHFIRKNSKGPYCKRGGVKSLSFIYHGDDGVPAVRDHRKQVGNFSPNSLGAVNGMNYKTVPIPDNADLNWFKKFID